MNRDRNPELADAAAKSVRFIKNGSESYTYHDILTDIRGKAQGEQDRLAAIVTKSPPPGYLK